jgi:hypothetical protein
MRNLRIEVLPWTSRSTGARALGAPC